jgi:membrane-bound lytic murein transglycosylase D
MSGRPPGRRSPAATGSHKSLLYIVFAGTPFVAGDCAIRPFKTLASLFVAALLVLGAGLASPSAQAADERIPFPAELQRDVDFWVRVYTEVTTSEGFLHDQYDLGIVYRTLRFERDVAPAARRDAVDDERKKIEGMLKRLAAGAADLSEEEQRIAAAFGAAGSRDRYAEAAKNVRFQLGQSDRFRAGLERSGQWEAHIAQAFANLGLPPQLAALPHVESSFDPTAYSKVGAAGLWQFMPGTGRRYLRIDDAVDERMDPFRATEAAAQLLDFNFRFLGSWPLALTAYNHGAAGMRRASDALGTADIATIVRNYKSPSFGFASRNFYVSFLAALTIDRNPEKYFGNLTRHPELVFTEVEMPAFIPLPVLEKTLRIDRARLAAMNPALRPPVWSGSRYVPKGYRLRLPPEARSWTSALLAQQVALSDQYLNQPRSRSHRVKSGETLAAIAKRYGLTASNLARLNGLADGATVKPRATLRLPDLAADRVGALQAAVAANEPGATAAAPVPATPPGGAGTPQVEEKVSQTLAETRAETRVASRAKPPEPVTASEVVEESPSLVPGGAVARASETIDFNIGEDNSIRVAAEETIGHYADWLKLPASRLRTLNKLSAGAAVQLGRSLKLDFSKVGQAQFDARRRAYHDGMQATFFAGHRITGTQVYVARRGDSLWNVAQRNGSLPTWLVLHYNPDLDFNALRAGQQIVIPKVEALPPA